jgi:hypothetical protein
MKTISTILLGFIILVNSAIAQTNKNGIIYDKHPAINIAEAFLQAYVTNNVEVLKKLADTGFNAYNVNTSKTDPLPPAQCDPLKILLTLG